MRGAYFQENHPQCSYDNTADGSRFAYRLLADSNKSEYIRERALNHRPKARLTEREIEAYISIADARADLVHIKNALSGKSQEELLRYFRDPHYMHKWIEATDYLIRRWQEIESYLAKQP